MEAGFFGARGGEEIKIQKGQQPFAGYSSLWSYCGGGSPTISVILGYASAIVEKVLEMFAFPKRKIQDFCLSGGSAAFDHWFYL